MKPGNEMKLIRISVLSLLVFLPVALMSADTISGKVFLDSNGNRQPDSGEQGISGVLVSNQQDVAVTDDQGSFRLPVRDPMVVFVTKPAGYQTPVNEDMLPQFYYIHDRDGSPGLKFPGVEPTGELPEQLNFPLYQTEKSDTFSAVILSDPQPQTLQEVRYVRDDVASELVGTDAAFGITLGDIMFDDLSLFDEYNAYIGKIGIPFYNVPGNHDMNYDSRGDEHALETYTRTYGPPFYAFEYGKVHFIVLDNVEWSGATDESDGSYRGALGERQLTWLSNHLQHVPDDRLIVLNMHIPLVTRHSNAPNLQVANRGELFPLLDERSHLLSLAGHLHLLEHYQFGEEEGWHGAAPFPHITLAAVSGSWWHGPKDARGIPIADQGDGVPNGYHIFTFRGTDFTQRFKPAHRSKKFQIRISFTRDTQQTSGEREPTIFANVFNGSPDTGVRYRIDGGPFRTMAREFTYEPYSARIFGTYPEFGTSWVEAKRVTHLWTASFPEDLKPGVHVVTVQASNVAGVTYRQSRIFDISRSIE